MKTRSQTRISLPAAANRAVRAFLFAGLVLAGSLRAQTALNLSSATGWGTVTGNTNAAVTFIDYNTHDRFTTSDNNSTSTYNLVGGSSTAAGATVTTNPMFQMQTAYIGGTAAANLGVAFRLRLGSYDLQTIGNTGLTLLVGVGSSSSPGAAQFAIGATFTSSNSALTSWSVFTLDGGTNSSATPSLWDTATGGLFAGQTKSTFATGTSADAAYLNYQSTGNDVFNSTASRDTSDAWLTFGITFDRINSVISSSARGGTTYDATTTTWNYSAVVFSGTNTATWTAKDWIAPTTSTTNTTFSDFIYTHGGTTPVPEPTTYLMVAGLLLPSYLYFHYKRKRARPAPAA